MHGNGPAAGHLTEHTIVNNLPENRIMKKLTKYFTEKQKTIFLIDSLGAFMTAFFLFVIMRHLSGYFGMPQKELLYLFVLAISFCIYSAACFLFLKGGLTAFIRFIAIANLLYCAFTTGLLIKYHHLLTIIGTIYFLIEIVIICGLSYMEFSVAKRIKEKQIASQLNE